MHVTKIVQNEAGDYRLQLDDGRFALGASHVFPTDDDLSTVNPSIKQTIDDGNITEVPFVPMSLEDYKAQRHLTVNAQTDALILGGFLHPLKADIKFGLKNHDQRNFLGYRVMLLTGVPLTGMFHRCEHEIDGVWVPESYYFESDVDYQNLYQKGVAMISVCTKTGADIKDAILAATTKEDVDAILDSRTWDQMDAAAHATIEALLGP